MTIEQELLERLRGLSPEKQQQVLNFAQKLGKNSPKQRLESLEGLWADLNIKITDEDIAEARREMWGNFPRDMER